jgi:hypothetical protein
MAKYGRIHKFFCLFSLTCSQNFASDTLKALC